MKSSVRCVWQADGPITDDVKEELEKKALKEGFCKS